MIFSNLSRFLQEKIIRLTMIILTAITSVNLLWIHIFSVSHSKQVDRKLRTTLHCLGRHRIAEIIVRITVSFLCPHKRDFSQKETTIIEIVLSLSHCMIQLYQGRQVKIITMDSGSNSSSINPMLLIGIYILSLIQLRMLLIHRFQHILRFKCKNKFERYV